MTLPAASSAMAPLIDAKSQKVILWCGLTLLFFGLIYYTPSGASGLRRLDGLASRSGSSPSLADGCKHVFIDAGSNRGVHGRMLFEPDKYPLSKFPKLYDQVFGSSRNNAELCVFAFEPNPMHADRQKEISETYAKMGWRYHFIPAALMDEEGTMTFYRNSKAGKGDDGKEEWGFSLRMKQLPEIMNTEEDQKVVVDVIDFSKWITDNIKNRKIPGGGGASGVPPKVFMKIDVEGAEYRVLAKLNADGNMCMFDKITGEVHPFSPDEPSVRLHPDWVAMGLGWEQKDVFLDSLNNMMRASGCPTIETFDDESYLHDTPPLPSPRL